MTTTSTEAMNLRDSTEAASAATRSDVQLLLDYRASGNGSAFAALVHRYERELYNYLNGLKYREAAEVLSIPLGTVKSRMHTALKMLGQMPAATELALTS